MRLRTFRTYILLLLAPLLAGCGAEIQLRKAEQSLALGEYTAAAALFKRAYTATPSKERAERAARAFKLAECYRRVGYASRAAAAYQNAVRYSYPDSTALKHLAAMQLKMGDYKNAVKNYTLYLEKAPHDTLALAGLNSARSYTERKERGSRYVVRKENVLNSKYSDFSPVLAGTDCRQLYFTSSRDNAQGSEINGITGMKSCDIYLSELDEKGKWQKPKPLEGGPNSEYEDGSCAFTPDFATMYYTSCTTDAQFARHAQIWSSRRSDAAWQTGSPYGTGADTLISYAHPAISADSKWLYFCSDMPGGYGGFDIWRVPLGERLIGAQNLGPEINTAGDEKFPTCRRNGELYFSSDGHDGMGGLDIYKAQLNDTVWVVEPMPYPINSSADDFGITFEGDYTRGFFSSNRNDARGRDNIYSFFLPETVHTITGWVYEKDGYELPQGLVRLVGEDGTNIKISVRADGSFTQRVEPGTKYLLLGTHKGYMNYKVEMETDSTVEDRNYVLQFPLSSITKPVLIDNIFFDFDKATLRPESGASLDELALLLEDNPNVTIEIGAHCDYKGQDAYNERLSQARAESVVGYLKSKGIEPARLTAKGYGESRPKVISKKEAERLEFLPEDCVLSESFITSLPEDQAEICNQLNRRTEFRVIRTTYGLFGE